MLRSFRCFRSKNDHTLGVDITENSVNLIELSRKNHQFCVENYRIVPVPNGVMSGHLVHQIDALADCIRVHLKESKLTLDQAILAIPDACTICKVIQVSDALSTDDIEELVQMEIDQYIPDVIHEVHFDFKLLGTNQPGFRDLLIVACRSEYVNSRVRALRLVGLKTTYVDVESYAIQRVVQYMTATKLHAEKPMIVLLDIHSAHINFFVFHELQLIFTHQELYRDQFFLFVSIERLFQFFYSAHPQKIITEIFVCGQLTADIVGLLQETLQASVMLLNPFINMSFAKDINPSDFFTDASRFITASGLAMRV